MKQPFGQWLALARRVARRQAAAEHASLAETEIPSTRTASPIPRSVPSPDSMIGSPWDVTEFMDTLPLEPQPAQSTLA